MSDNPFAAGDNPYQAPVTSPLSADVDDTDAGLGRAADMLRQTRPWVRFISVMFFICAVLLALSGVLFLAFAGPGMPRGMPGIGPVIGAIYIVMAGLYIAPGAYLWMYADRINVFMRHQTPSTLASALEAQKSFWRFVGIVMLVVIVVYLVVVAFAIIA